MFKLINLLKINDVKIKYILIFLLLLVSLFIAFNHYPPIITKWEMVEIYRDFRPTHNLPLIFSISEDPNTTGPFNTFGYAALIISRYVSDYLGHSLSNIRSPSIVYGLVALFLLYTIVNRWFEWKVAFISTFLLATNQYFLMLQHFLLPHMVTLTSILFCIERFQNLLVKNNKFAILSFGFACAFTTFHYWTGRWVMLCVLFFYLVDFEKFSIWKYKTYLHFTNLKRIKTLLLVFISMVFVLTVFYPGNLLLLFSTDFIYPSIRAGSEYSNTATQMFYDIWYNLKYFFNYYIFHTSSHPSNIMSLYFYPIENMVILALCLLGIIISLIRKTSYSVLFLLYILFITFFSVLVSTTNSASIYEASSTMNAGRIFFIIPFVCIIAALGIRYIYAYGMSKGYSLKPVFILLIGIFFCFRIYGYFSEIERFKTYVHSYKIDFSQPSISQDIDSQNKKRQLIKNLFYKEIYNQLYYYRMAQFISKNLKTLTLKPNSINLLYIPEKNYTPFMLERAAMPKNNKGYPYFFSMHLTFYLQEKGLNVSYLVKKNDTQETFFNKSLKIVELYKLRKNIDPDDAVSTDRYPRNKKQEKIVKIFIVIIDWVESYKIGKKWLNSIREKKSYHSKVLPIGDYFVNITSNKAPDYLIITSKEELEYVQKRTDYKISLSLPIR